jgi:predicted transcriptional regulator
METTTRSFSIPKRTSKLIDRLAKVEDRKKSNIVERAVDEYAMKSTDMKNTKAEGDE